MSTNILGFFKTGKEVKLAITSGEDTPLKELLPSISIETHRPKYLRRESDDSERSLRPHGRIDIQEKFVSIASYVAIHIC